MLAWQKISKESLGVGRQDLGMVTVHKREQTEKNYMLLLKLTALCKSGANIRLVVF